MNEAKNKNSLPSGVRCCIRRCQKSRRHFMGLKMFKFPPPNTTHGKIWREKCQIPQEDYDKKLYICANHFSSSYVGKKKLKADAIPTISLNEMEKLEEIESQFIADPEIHPSCDTFIKQESPSAEEEFISTIDSTDLNIPVKNEPILDEYSQPLNIKNEPLSEVTYLEGAVTVKTENALQNQEIVPEGKDTFIVYELDTNSATHKLPSLAHRIGQQVSELTFSSTSQTPIPNSTKTEKLIGNESRLISNLIHCNVKDITANIVADPTVTASPPILLNAQLRKRNKVTLPANSIDKRTRYNIEGITPTLLDKNRAATDSTETSNTGCKKIINLLMKFKRLKRKREESYKSRESSALSAISQNSIVSTIGNESLKPASSKHFNNISTNTQTQENYINSISPTTMAPLSVIYNSTDSPKQSTDSPIISELRVKCLCSLTDDTTTDNLELEAFFKEMYEKTRRLKNTQQRRVKVLLLKAICDAEESVEEGKCCTF